MRKVILSLAVFALTALPIMASKATLKTMRKQHLILAILSIALLACQDTPQSSTASYDIGLVESKKITLPIDENTYYLSKRIFQYEENGNDFLAFGNFEKGAYEIILFNIDKEDIHKRIPLMEEGPNGVPAIMGFKPFGDSNRFITYQHNLSRISIISGKGEVLRHYFTDPGDGRFIRCNDGLSYSGCPTFIKDSVVYFSSGTQKRGMKHYEWQTLPMFSSLDLKTGKIDQPSFFYPPIFKQDMKNIATGYNFTYDYNYL